MAIAVVGMHRSGTSMVTRMLAGCGLELGPLHELLGPSSENPTGYWERRPMVALDDAVLDALGLAWDHVPLPPTGDWMQRPELREHLEAARELVASFGEDRTWGWKDPRSSFTLPLWEAAAGASMDVVACVRNPLDVAASLAARGGMSARLAFSLWHAYSEAALALARERRHVVTHYDSYFADPRAELVRVCGAVGLDPDDAALDAAAASADGAHRHSSSGLAQLVRSTAPDATVALYLELLAASGETMAQVARADELVLEVDDDGFDRAEAVAWVADYRATAGLAAPAAR